MDEYLAKPLRSSGYWFLFSWTVWRTWPWPLFDRSTCAGRREETTALSLRTHLHSNGDISAEVEGSGSAELSSSHKKWDLWHPTHELTPLASGLFFLDHIPSPLQRSSTRTCHRSWNLFPPMRSVGSEKFLLDYIPSPLRRSSTLPGGTAHYELTPLASGLFFLDHSPSPLQCPPLGHVIADGIYFLPCVQLPRKKFLPHINFFTAEFSSLSLSLSFLFLFFIIIFVVVYFSRIRLITNGFVLASSCHRRSPPGMCFVTTDFHIIIHIYCQVSVQLHQECFVVPSTPIAHSHKTSLNCNSHKISALFNLSLSLSLSNIYI